jgi:S1-C subfamily serine protease
MLAKEFRSSMPIYYKQMVSQLDDALVEIVDMTIESEKANANAVGLLFKKEYTSSVNNFTSSLQSFYEKVYPKEKLVSFLKDRLALAEFAETGTCFLVNKNLVFSAKHVIEGNNPEDFRVIFKGWRKKSGNLLEKSQIYKVKSIKQQGAENEDWVTLVLEKNVDEGIKPLQMIRNSQIKENTKLYILGFPLSLPQRCGRGKVISNVLNEPTMRTQVDAFIGNSGSPVFNEDGLVVGMYIQSGDDFNKQDVNNVTLVMDGENGQNTTTDTVLKIPDEADFR